MRPASWRVAVQFCDVDRQYAAAFPSARLISQKAPTCAVLEIFREASRSTEPSGSYTERQSYMLQNDCCLKDRLVYFIRVQFLSTSSLCMKGTVRLPYTCGCEATYMPL